MFFALFLYNESVMISSLNAFFIFTLPFNVKFTLNIKSVILTICNGMTLISRRLYAKLIDYIIRLL